MEYQFDGQEGETQKRSRRRVIWTCTVGGRLPGVTAAPLSEIPGHYPRGRSRAAAAAATGLCK